MIEERTSHSLMGIASFLLASFAGLLLAGLFLLAVSLSGWDPPGDEAAYGFGLIMAGLMAVLAQIAALALGVAGALQRRHKRSFAFLGVACSILVLVAIVAQVGPAEISSFVASFSEPQPQVHYVSPGNE